VESAKVRTPPIIVLENRVKSVDYYRIDLNKIARKYRSPDLLQVTRASPLKLRQEVERFAIYFQREFEYSVREFTAKEKRPYTAYLLSESERRVWIGACFFRPQSGVSALDRETLRWIWLHPYCRLKGVLTEVWPKLRAAHGDFFIEPPFSPVMRHFLLKHNSNSQFYSFYQNVG
jgi:hypothetical protein